MSIPIDDPPSEVLRFLTERHLASLTTISPKGRLQVTPVGFTFDRPDGDTPAVARVITWASSVKSRNVAAAPGSQVALCQVDGARWLTIYGSATLRSDPDTVERAVGLYTERYRPPKQRDDRTVIEITVERLIGRV